MRSLLTTGTAVLALLAAPVLTGAQTAQRAQPITASEVPQKKTVAALPPRGTYVPARTPWGDPDITGDYNNSDESGVPFERPDAFAGRRLQDVAPQELAKLVEERQRQTIERAPTLSEFPGATSPMHWFENYNAVNSRAWLVSDPPDGKVPPQTAEAQQRAAARAAARKGRGPADSWEDRSLYDRCITRGLPAVMLPAIYNNNTRIVQSPGYVALTHEMIHETRVVPLDEGPIAHGRLRGYLGDSRGGWDGDTLVIETRNFSDKTNYRGAGAHLRLMERFRRTQKGLRYEVTVDDRHTFMRAWTAALNLRPGRGLYEYACHEGNYSMRNMLSAARAAEAGKRVR